MSQIKKIPRKDMDRWTEIVCNAYPGMRVVSEEDKRNMRDRLWTVEKEDPDINMYALYRKGVMVGGMRLFDFTMTMLTRQIPVGGLGLVAVDLAHKRQHVCKELVEYYINHYAKKKTPLLALYPFRPDFYRKMGFGYGTKINQYRFKPGDLPKGPMDHIVFAGPKDKKAMTDCYHRTIKNIHGMMKRTRTHLSHPPANMKMVAVKKGKKIEGFLIFNFKTSTDENWLDVRINIMELVYENREALFQLLAFLNSQSDQVNTITYATHDEYFHFLPCDPRAEAGRLIPPIAHETNVSGVGIMYRIIDTPGLFRLLKDHNFNNQTCRLKITVEDTLYPKHAGSYIIDFIEGKPQVRTGHDCDVEISLDVADYSSMVMGVVPFDKLYEYGLAKISNIDHLETVTRIFTTPKKPICITGF